MAIFSSGETKLNHKHDSYCFRGRPQRVRAQDSAAIFSQGGSRVLRPDFQSTREKPASLELKGYRKAVESILERSAGLNIQAIGYRVVHGGDLYFAPTVVDDSVLEGLRSLARLAPEHLPAAIAAIEIARRRFPEVKHVACFDTAFHHSMPGYAKRFALPNELWSEGFHKYGFHGLSYEYVVQELGANLPDRTIIAHLGNGSSMVALRAGHPVDTTMGMTPAGGMMMGSRSGDLDPGVAVRLLREKKLTAPQLDELVNQKSGLKGVSGLTSDMRTLLAERAGNSSAALAITMYCYHARKHIGALAAVLGGLDLLVFTGGIGENCAIIREDIFQNLEFLQCRTQVVPTHETRMLARHLSAMIRPD
ncbi:acetate/propionate family kinase (plasmid) [Verrucomicrobiaceae bacterium 227]